MHLEKNFFKDLFSMNGKIYKFTAYYVVYAPRDVIFSGFFDTLS